MFIKLNQIQKFLLIFLPFSLFIGNFVLNLNIILIDLLFLILLKINKNYSLLLDKIKSRRNKYLILILISLFLLNIFFSDDIFLSLKGFIGFIKNFILIFALAFFFDNKDNFKVFLNIFTFLLAFLFIDLLIQYNYGKDIFGFEWFVDNNNRLSGFFGDEYVAGSYISKIIFFVFLNLGIFFNKKFEGYLKLIYLCLTIIILFFVGERAALVITIFASLIYVFLNFGDFKTKVFYLILFTFITTISSYVISKNFKEKNIFLKTQKQFQIQNTDDKNEVINKVSESVYFDLFKTSFEIFKQNKIFGSGLRTFKVSCDKAVIVKSGQTTKGVCTTHPHNLYFEILSELGIFFFLIFLSFHLYIFFKIISSLTYDKAYLLPMLAQGIVLFFPLQTTGSYFSSWNSFFYVLFYSLVVNYFFLKKTNK